MEGEKQEQQQPAGFKRLGSSGFSGSSGAEMPVDNGASSPIGVSSSPRARTPTTPCAAMRHKPVRSPKPSSSSPSNRRPAVRPVKVVKNISSGSRFYANVVANLLKEKTAAMQAQTHDHYLAERRAQQARPCARSPPKSPIAKSNKNTRWPSSRPRGATPKLMSDIDAITACSNDSPATADPAARGTGSFENRRRHLRIIIPGSPVLETLATIEASVSPAIITRSQASEMQAGFFSLTLARTPSASERGGERRDGSLP